MSSEFQVSSFKLKVAPESGARGRGRGGSPAEGKTGLRLWLPGYHTPSLNRTAGKHWAKVRRLRLETAAALYEALRGQQFQVPSSRFQVEAAKRVLSKIVLKVPLETRRGKKPDKPKVPAWLRIERVACVLLDEENFEGGTKGLTDLLRYAFPTVLLDDGPGYVVMEHVQTRCAKRCEEGTWIDLRLGQEGPD
jgi:hypothetical protein